MCVMCTCSGAGGGGAEEQLVLVPADAFDDSYDFGARWRPTEQGKEEKMSRRTEAHRGAPKEVKVGSKRTTATGVGEEGQVEVDVGRRSSRSDVDEEDVEDPVRLAPALRVSTT